MKNTARVQSNNFWSGICDVCVSVGDMCLLTLDVDKLMNFYISCTFFLWQARALKIQNTNVDNFCFQLIHSTSQPRRGVVGEFN